MGHKELLNQQYSNLCQQLGDAILNREKLDAHIDSLKQQIKVLDSAMPVLDAITKIQPVSKPKE